jgi:DNA-binding Lrp family transcriptional regulator
MDQDEKKILSELMKNSNKNIEMVAQLCAFSKQKTCRIIKRLEEKGVIWGYTTIFNEGNIGLKHFMLMVKRTMKQLDEATVEKIVSRQLENLVKERGVTVENSSYVHGDYDWVLTFTATDIIQAKKFSDSLVALHPGAIEKVMILQTLMFIRKHYILNPENYRLREFI